MSQCAFGYASGFRFKSGLATVELDGKVLRVIRDGTGKSSDDCFAGKEKADGAVGRITFKELARRTNGAESTITLRDDDGTALVTLPFNPSHAMGRLGRDFDEFTMRKIVQNLTGEERRALAKIQVDTLPDTLGTGAWPTTKRLENLMDAIGTSPALSAKLVTYPHVLDVLPLYQMEAWQAHELLYAAGENVPAHVKRVLRGARDIGPEYFWVAITEHDDIEGSSYYIRQGGMDTASKREVRAAVARHWDRHKEDGQHEWEMLDNRARQHLLVALSHAVHEGAVSIAEIDANGPLGALKEGKRRAQEGTLIGYPLIVNPPNLEDIAARTSVYGVEWTKNPAGLDGNIDPQHSTRPGLAVAAVQEALTAPLPTRGSTLVTVRPDLDAYGAVAVLNERATQGPTWTPGPDVLDRIEQIAAADVRNDLARQPWTPTEYDPDHIDDPDLHALSVAATARGVATVDGVRITRDWLLDGKLPENAATIIETTRQNRRAAVEDIQVRGALTLSGTVVPVANVTSTSFIAVDYGYCFAPVVIAENPAFLTPGSNRSIVRRTIAIHPGADGDMRDGLVDALNAAEIAAGGTAGWGGQGKIIGSPQGADSRIASEELRELVASWAATHVQLSR